MKTDTIKNLVVLLLAFTVAVSMRADTITWTNTSGGNWSAAANWDPNQVPGSSDDAVITASGNYTVTLDTSPTVNSLALGGASGTQALNTAGNSLAVNNPSAINSNGIFVLNGGSLAGAFNFGGTLNWESGALGNGSWLTVASNGVMNIQGSIQVEGALTNEGTVNWQAGEVDIYGPGGGYSGAIWNEAGALWDIQCDQTLGDFYGGEFYNAGMLQKDTTTGTTSFNVYLANGGGTVHAESGTIDFGGGSDLGGIFQADTNAAIYFVGGNMTLSSPPDFQGPGVVQLTGGYLTLTNFVGTFSVNGSTLEGQNTIAAGGTLNWESGALDNGASLTVAGSGVMNIQGSIQVEGALTNEGTVNWQAGEVGIYGPGGGYSGAIWNEAGALWDIQCDQTLGDIYGGEFYNAGMVQKDTTTGTTSFNVYLANGGGTVHAKSGTIDFGGGSDLGGIFQADTNAAIYFVGGTFTISSTITNFQGPGVVQLTGGYLTLTNFVGTFDLNGPTLVGQNTIAAGGTLNWESGALGNGSWLTVAGSGVVNIQGSIQLYGALTNCGTVNWQAGEVDIYGPVGGYSGAIWNEAGALWDIQCDQTLGDIYGGEFYNAGMVQKDTTTGTTSFNAYLANGGGTVHAESGTIDFGGSDLGGIFQADTNAAIYFVGGTFTISSTITNFQGPGVVQLTGGYLTLTNFVGTFDLNGPTLVGQNTIAASSTLNWESGALGNGSWLTVAGSGVVNIQGSIQLYGALTNCGTVNWQAGEVDIYGPVGGYSGAIWNEAGALWDIQCDQTLGDIYGGEFYNAGMVQKDTTTGTTSFNAYLANGGGTVHAESGTIDFGGSDLGGIFQADTNAAIYFVGGTFTISSTITNFQGPGVVQLTGGYLTLTNFVGTFDLNGPTLVGQNTIAASSTLNWESGALGNGSWLTVASNGVMNIQGSIQVEGALTNEGTVNWQAGEVDIYGPGGGYSGAIWNEAGALWDIQCDQSMGLTYWSPEFYNAGVVQKDTTTGTTSFNVHLANGGGTVHAESGTISLNGSYSLTGGILDVGINSQTNFGQIVLSGNAALDGTFSANLNNGFVPTNNSSFQVLTFNSASGAFTNITASAPPIWQTNFTATGLTLTTVSSIAWATPSDITYGAALGANQLNASAGVTGSYAYAPPAGTVLQSGNGQILAVTFTPDNSTYIPATLQVPINVLKAPLTISAISTNKIYGQTVTLTGTEFTSTGLVNGDTATNVTLSSDGVPVTATVPGSPYSIVPGSVEGTGLTNYIITYVNGTLTVNPAPLTITANNRGKTYGQAATFAGTEFIVAGLLNNDAATSVTLASSGAAATAAVSGSPYNIVPSAAMGSGLDNYIITYLDGTLTVSPAGLTITANNRAKAYGQTVTFASTEFMPSGLQNSETVGSVTLSSSGAISNAPVSGSPYSIIPAAATGGTFNPANYSITYVNGILTVNPAILTITASNQNKVYGQALTFGSGSALFSSSGLQNNETVGTVTLAVSGNGGAVTADAGSYTITPSVVTGGTFNSSNYTIVYDTGTLTVNPAPLTITANNRSKTYGQTVTFAGTEFTVSGLLNDDTATSVTLNSSGAVATAAVSGSPYNIVPSAAVGTGLGNYAITYENGTLVINQANLTITAITESKMYGQTLAFGGGSMLFSSSGLQNNETVGTVTLAVSGNAGAATAGIGTYTITPSGANGGTFNSSNYTIAYDAGTLTVNPASLTITANNRSKTYGQTVTFAGTEFTPSGLQNSETVGSAMLNSSGAISNAPVNGSPYSIVPSAATGGTFSPTNYNIAYVNGALTINPASLTITADNTNKIFGQKITFTGTEFAATGLQNGETVSTVTLTSTGAAATAAVGAYDIVPSAPAGGTFVQSNYSDSFVDGTLTVSAQPLLTVTLNGTNTVITFPTMTGEAYQLQSNTGLLTSEWVPVGGSIEGTGEFISVTNPIVSQTAFYRLQIQN